MANYFTVNGKKYEGTRQEAELEYEGRSEFNYKQTFEDFVEENGQLVYEPASFTEAERKFLDYQTGASGSFYKALIQAILKADQGHQANLSKAYPELVEVVRRYQNESGYWEQLEARWNKFINR